MSNDPWCTLKSYRRSCITINPLAALFNTIYRGNYRLTRVRLAFQRRDRIYRQNEHFIRFSFFRIRFKSKSCLPAVWNSNKKSIQKNHRICIDDLLPTVVKPYNAGLIIQTSDGRPYDTPRVSQWHESLKIIFFLFETFKTVESRNSVTRETQEVLFFLTRCWVRHLLYGHLFRKQKPSLFLV